MRPDPSQAEAIQDGVNYLERQVCVAKHVIRWRKEALIEEHTVHYRMLATEALHDMAVIL
ncbi:hypothetical protein [Candidatus Aalborgicola defluviihabitans]|uniref:hypothetical protein n=1 Tax=Candidatus Aalborgicola defluviihabitans TaxID=3386187 RepID=UPI0039B87630